ncbi:hypothetical protein ACFLZV_02330 [Candidatus Margulisiibacteriota bacterium]
MSDLYELKDLLNQSKDLRLSTKIRLYKSDVKADPDSKDKVRLDKILKLYKNTFEQDNTKVVSPNKEKEGKIEQDNTKVVSPSKEKEEKYNSTEKFIDDTKKEVRSKINEMKDIHVLSELRELSESKGMDEWMYEIGNKIKEEARSAIQARMKTLFKENKGLNPRTNLILERIGQVLDNKQTSGVESKTAEKALGTTTNKEIKPEPDTVTSKTNKTVETAPGMPIGESAIDPDDLNLETPNAKSPVKESKEQSPKRNFFQRIGDGITAFFNYLFGR